jgi:hypothetical protein
MKTLKIITLGCMIAVAAYSQGLADSSLFPGSNYLYTADGTTGVTVNKYVKYNSGISGVIVGATTDTASAFLGISTATQTGGQVMITRFGPATAAMDGATTAGHYAGLSVTTAGDLVDLGATKTPQAVGVILQTLGSAGNSAVDLFGPTQSGLVSQNSQSTAYTTVWSDAGLQILHPTADNNARTFTIAANSSVPYPVGTVITFINQINTLTIAITTDTLTWGSNTGSRTLAAGSSATAIKVTSTIWFINGGPGLT